LLDPVHPLLPHVDAAARLGSAANHCNTPAKRHRSRFGNIYKAAV
jgi:hypothetical protein